jgi:EAL domain-containing protein (putative c-di-GMP-specific phosphodiesterase class I)
MAELDTARAAIEELQSAGVQVLLDDFGTGYSSLARLGELPISGLKIDRRFARGLGHDPAVMPVVRAIADLARAYGLQVVVEGIEDGAALASVDELHCEYAQGYHLGRPAPPEQVERLLAVPLSRA